MTVTINSPVWEQVGIPPEPVRRFTIDEYHSLINTGILDEDNHVELLEGYIVEKMSKNRAHALVNQILLQLLLRILPAGWHVQAQEPITTDTSEPEPDICIVRGTLLDYPDSHPYADNVGIVVEISDSSLRRDRTTKMRIYASAGISEYWIVNLIENQIEIYSEPSGISADPAYRQQQTYRAGMEFAVRLESETIALVSVDDILV